MNSYTVILLVADAGIEGTGVTLFKAEVSAASADDAGHQAFNEMLTVDDWGGSPPEIIDVMVFSGKVDDLLDDSSLLVLELNAP